MKSLVLDIHRPKLCALCGLGCRWCPGGLRSNGSILYAWPALHHPWAVFPGISHRLCSAATGAVSWGLSRCWVNDVGMAIAAPTLGCCPRYFTRSEMLRCVLDWKDVSWKPMGSCCGFSGLAARDDLFLIS